ncbi:GNAT family N-acetyltransferase [Algibacter sp. Ld11]|uniref:GNAT family N-acetyltransferase n=1 Tax=Algibacter sp. Ld11 TaxID=649150 RepID=UPI0038673491
MKKQNYTIKQIEAKETHIVRHPVLRQGKPVTSCVFEGDNLETTLHFGIYNSEELIGVCSFLKNRNHNFKAQMQYQLRGMAVLEAYQGLGVGHKLLKYCDAFLFKKSATLIWCNAREVAVSFYMRNGYIVFGDSFNIADIGPHFVMTKCL